jgi:branched-chain amino acid transport system ATP-binding protein
VLELIDVHSYYRESHILRGVSLKVNTGTTVALLGRNGMGKTTTVRSIMGLTPARNGTVRYNGGDITRLAPQQIARAGIALVPQGRHIFPSLSVRENLVISMKGKGFSLDTIHSYFPVLARRANHRGNELSGGEQQMLAIARALLGNPELILMDEASEGLAPVIIDQISDIILEIKRKRLSILLVEQNVALALKVSDYAYVLHMGEIVHHCSITELAGNERIQAEYIGIARRRRAETNDD